MNVTRGNNMQVLSLIIGIFSMLVFFIAAIPLFVWMNWPNLPITIAGIVLGVMGMLLHGSKKSGIIGITLCTLAFILCILRLKFGFDVMLLFSSVLLA
jgi:hypothetical protein